MFRNHFVLAYRSLVKKKWFTAMNIGGLAIGMAASILILNYISFEYSYDKMHANGDQIYRVESNFYEGDVLTDEWPTASFGYAPAMKQHISGIKDFVRIDIRQPERIVRYENKKYRENSVVTTEPSFFTVFSFPLLKGNPKEALNGPNKVVITEPIAKKYFGNDDPMGKILTISTSTKTLKCEVSGVMEKLPKNSHFNHDFFISWETLPNWLKDFWYMHETYSYVLLEKGFDTKKIEASFPEMAEQYKTKAALKNKRWAITLNPLSEIHLSPQKQYERGTKGSQQTINILILAALAILIIAWINYINLTTASSLERAKEVGVRKVLGAFKNQLISRFMIEAVLVNLIALIIAALIVVISFSFFNLLIGKNISFVLYEEPLFWGVLVLIFILGLFFSGYYPAHLLSSVKPARILKGKFINSKKTGLVQQALVIFQFTVSLILICGSIIVYSQLKFMQDQSLGMNIDKTLAIKFPANAPDIKVKFPAFIREMRALPGIDNASISNAVPGMEVATFLSNHRADDETPQNRLYEMLSVDYNFIDTYKLQLAAGRGFSESHKNDQNNIVINEASVKALGFLHNEDALGKKIMLEGDNKAVQIIGVLKNYHQQGLNKSYTPIMLFIKDRIKWISSNYISIKMSNPNTVQINNQISALWTQFFPDSTYDSFFVDQYYKLQYGHDQRFGKLFALFTALAIFIASLGLWSLVLFTALLRTKEMGIRKILGATDGNLFINLSKEFLYLIGIAILIGLPISYLIMQNWLKNYAFKTDLNWWIFVLAGVLLLGIALITIMFQSYKVATKNPVDSLREE